MKCAARGSLKIQDAKKTSKICHMGTIAQRCQVVSSQLRRVLTIGKMFKSDIFPTCSHNMVNFGLLTADICWRDWGTAANFNGFRVLASLLQRRRSTEVNQTLHDVWPSPGLVHYVYNFRGSCLVTEICHVQKKFTLCPSHAFSYIGSVTARHSSSGRASAKVCGVVQ